MTAIPLGVTYRRLWSATLLANLGDGVRAAAFPLLAATLTHNPVLIAGVAIAGELPGLLFGLPAGVIADRVNRRQLLIMVDAVRVALLATMIALVAAHAATIIAVYAVVFICGLAEILRDTTAGTMVPSVVHPDQLDRANGRMVTAEIAGNEFIGPPLGGYLFGIAMVLPFAVNGGTLTLAVVLIASMPALFRPRREPTGQPDLNSRIGISAGIQWVVRHRSVWPVPVTTIALAMTDSAWFSLLVLYIRDVLALPTVWYGVLLGIGAVGGLAGGFIAARVSELLGPKKVTLCCLGLAASGQLLLGTTNSVIATATVLATSSMAFAIWNVIARTSIQRATPADLLGRVISIIGTIITAASILGAFLGGLAADQLGLHAPFLLGLPVLVAAGVFVAARKSIAPTRSK